MKKSNKFGVHIAAAGSEHGSVRLNIVENGTGEVIATISIITQRKDAALRAIETAIDEVSAASGIGLKRH